MTDGDGFAAAGPLFDELFALADDDPRRDELRKRIATIYQPVVRGVAARFAGRGEDRDDLEQVAAIGLVKAVSRFDPSRGVAFLGFAIPTMVGEVRRYFRDSAWSIRLPRRLSELCLALNRAAAELSQELGSAPTPRQIARHLSITVDEVYEGLEAGQSYRTTPLDASPEADDAAAGLAERLGSDDPRFAIAEDRLALRPALEAVPPRERRILAMRFFEGLTQTQIAARVGLSQMQVSRLLSRTLEQLRHAMSQQSAAQAGPPSRRRRSADSGAASKDSGKHDE